MWSLIADNLSMLMEGAGETLYMTFVSALFAYVLGLPLGVALIVTDKNGLKPMKALNTVLGWIVNIGRSIPFVILMLAIAPFTRLIVGKAFGTTATIVPLVVAAAPFVARMVEQSLSEIDHGVVEAARTMGASTFQIVWKVLLPESVPSLIRGVAVTVITLVSYSAMAGALGGGGLGDIAVRYGMHRYQYDVMMLTLVLIIIIVQVIQVFFDIVAKRIDKRTR
ncbi:MAG: methionine ABC transporter permease [Candidatus Spyradocola sp.]|nr:methionine ABC transporter permease [Candidatus Spyradocola sp.]